jgi:hypothetical protein
MPDLDDFEIDDKREPEEPEFERGPELPPRPESGLPKTLIAAVAVVLAVAASLFFVFRSAAPKPVPSAAPAAPLPGPTPAAEPSVALPTLEESDPFVRDLARGLSTHPQLGVWLGARGLVRVFTVAVQNVAEGRSPAPFLPFLTPTVRFQAIDRQGRVLVDPQSYAAYDDFADGVAALDAAECARVYRILAPLFAAAYGELGSPAGTFEQALSRGIDVVRTTPVPEGEILLRRGPVFLEFADPKLEALPLAQKQVLRMGPRNAGLVKAKVEEIAQALGLPSPAPSR